MVCTSRLAEPPSMLLRWIACLGPSCSNLTTPPRRPDDRACVSSIVYISVADDLALGGRGERVAALGEDPHHVVGGVAAGEVETEDGVRERVD